MVNLTGKEIIIILLVEPFKVAGVNWSNTASCTSYLSISYSFCPGLTLFMTCRQWNTSKQWLAWHRRQNFLFLDHPKTYRHTSCLCNWGLLPYVDNGGWTDWRLVVSTSIQREEKSTCAASGEILIQSDSSVTCRLQSSWVKIEWRTLRQFMVFKASWRLKSFGWLLNSVIRCLRIWCRAAGFRPFASLLLSVDDDKGFDFRINGRHRAWAVVSLPIMPL